MLPCQQRGLVGAMAFGGGDQRGQVRQAVADPLMHLGGVLLLGLDEPARVARAAPGLGTAHGAQDGVVAAPIPGGRDRTRGR